VADKAFPTSDSDVAFVRERNQFPVAEFFQFIARINANGALEYIDAVPPGANLLGLRINRTTTRCG
jgi:hypothetical protein